MKFKYKEVIDLGFIRDEVSDSVYFDIHGTGYLLVYLQICYKNYDYVFNWSQENRCVNLLKCDKDGNIKMHHEVESMAQLKMLIELLKK